MFCRTTSILHMFLIVVIASAFAFGQYVCMLKRRRENTIQLRSNHIITHISSTINSPQKNDRNMNIIDLARYQQGPEQAACLRTLYNTTGQMRARGVKELDDDLNRLKETLRS